MEAKFVKISDLKKNDMFVYAGKEYEVKEVSKRNATTFCGKIFKANLEVELLQDLSRFDGDAYDEARRNQRFY